MAQSTGSSGQGSAVTNDLKANVAPVVDKLKSDVGSVTGEVKTVVGQINDEAGSQLSALAGEAKSKVAEATDKVKGVAAEQKDLLATQIGSVAEAMERVATDLEASNGAGAQYARIIADNAGQLSTTIRDNDVDQIMTKAQSFGRQQPVAFLGAAALLGFAASRFLLASVNRASQSNTVGDQRTNGGVASPSYTETN